MLVDGIILFVAALVAKGIVPGILFGVISEYGLPGAINDVLWGYIKKLLLQFEIYGAVSILLGVVLCVLGFTLTKKKAVAASPEPEATAE